MNRFLAAIKAVGQLGLPSVAQFALYRLGLVTGHYRRLTQKASSEVPGIREPGPCRPLFNLPPPEMMGAMLGGEGKAQLIREADEIAEGNVRLFGGPPVPLKLTFDHPLQHWTVYERDPRMLHPLYSGVPDIKFLWEGARFGWVFTLGRAYRLTKDERYAEVFWQYAESFLDANPPYDGPHWMSAQEVAIRLMALIWASQVFAEARSSTPERVSRLSRSVAAHAARIPPTLIYARSQGNNHLLTEAAGLFTAGLALPEHPSAASWKALGWKWLNYGFCAQIDGYGEYAQHSTNYHRLMLQVALWGYALIRSQDAAYFPHPTSVALARSVHWLLALIDSTGRVPNLGANDGAYLFPLTSCPFDDFRPVVYAAARAFLNYDLPRGAWDELSAWFSIPFESPKYVQLPRYVGDQIYGKDSWAYFRTAQFSSRPSHADQLHLDLWWRGLNVAKDAGTYLYNALPPWDNSLASAFVHNTITLNGRDQMSRAGRFLYLDWFNAYRKSTIPSEEGILQNVSGRHYGYKSRGVRHTRRITAFADGRWQVADEMLALRLPWQFGLLRFRLHWLLPDWDWEISNNGERVEIALKTPHGKLRLKIRTTPRLSDLKPQITLARAGESLYGGREAAPIMGWFSPTYGLKVPALSLAVEVSSRGEVDFLSEFIFPTEKV